MQITKNQLAKGVAAFVVAEQIIIGQVNRRRCNRNAALANQYREERNEVASVAVSLESKMNYLLDKLDENDVPMTEFDAIAFNNL